MKGGFLVSTAGKELLLKKNKLSPPFSTDPVTLGDISSTMMDFILKNSTITLLSAQSLYGYIYMAVLKDGVKSPLNVHSLTKCTCINPKDLSCDPNSEACMEEAKVFAFKLTFLSVQKEVSFSDGKNKKRTNITSDFMSECRTQYALYNQHLLAGEPLIPPMVSPKPVLLSLANSEASDYIKLLEPRAGILHEAKKNSSFSSAYGEGAKYLGVAFMKFATGYRTLGHYLAKDSLSTEEKTNFMNIGRFALVYLYMKYGIMHLDSHPENIMISKDEGFFLDLAGKPVRGKALIIDLGRIKKAVPDPMFSWENPSQILTFLQYNCTAGDRTIWWSYRWMTHYEVDYYMPRIVSSIRKNIEDLNTKHRAGMDPDMVDALVSRRVKEHIRDLVPKPNNTRWEVNSGVKTLHSQFELRMSSITPRFTEHGIKGDPVNMSVTEYEAELHELNPAVVAVKPPAFGAPFAIAASSVLEALRQIAVGLGRNDPMDTRSRIKGDPMDTRSRIPESQYLSL
jgi:hypothetical protein